jgi:hypothetical protein
MAFQAGGSMLFPGAPDPTLQGPPPEPTPTPPIAPAPAPAPPQQPAPALNTSPFLQGSEPQADTSEADLANAQKQDQDLYDKQEVSHRGDSRFLTRQPAIPTRADIEADPEYQKLQQAQDYINQHSAGQKPADISRAQNMINAKIKAVGMRFKNDFTAKQQDWRRQETDQLKNIEGDKLTGTALDDELGRIEQARTDATTAQAKDPYAQKISAYNPEIMNADQFGDAALRVAQLNNLPTKRATQVISHLALPVGTGDRAFNGRTGAAAAYYKVAGRDVIGNYVLQTDNGPVRVPPAQFRQIEAARSRAYKAAQAYAKEASKPKQPGGVGGFIARQFE